MKRRSALFAAVAMAAAAGGAGLAVRHSRPEPEGSTAAPVDLWSQDFEALDGSRLSLAGWRGRPLLVNFWATWCGPCVIEMPLLDRFASGQPSGGWRVLALAIDQSGPVRQFVTEHALRLPVALGGAGGIDLSRSLGNDRGALPFSVVFDSSGAAVERKLGAVSAELLSAWTGSTR